MSLPISPLRRSRRDLGGAADEMGGLHEFPAGAKLFSRRGLERSLQLLSRHVRPKLNPGVCFSHLPS